MKIFNYLFTLFIGLFLTSNLAYAQVGATCTTPDVISALPFSAAGLNTAGFGDDYSVSPCSNNYITGDDYVYEYTPAANEVVDVNLAGVAIWSGLHITEGCPDVSTNCVGSDTGSGSGTRSATGLSLTGGTTYYITISTYPAPQSTTFDITVDLTPACSVAPSGGVATNVTATSADLGWTSSNPGSTASIELVTAGTTPTGVGMPATGNPEAVTGLTAATDYEFYVQEDCGGGAPAPSMIISAVFDGPLSGGTPKGVELYVINNIADLSIYGVGTTFNGGGSNGADFTFPAVAATAGSYITITSSSAEFLAYFGVAADYTNGSFSINGDDAIELFENGALIDVFGDVNADGTGTAWEYLDGWAARVTGSTPTATFAVGDWTFSGINAIDGCTTNAACTSVIPNGAFTTPSTASLSPWGGPFAFSTPCAAIVPYYLQDFTTFPGICWEEASTGDPTTGPTGLGTGDWVADGWLNAGTTGAAKINLWNTGTGDWILSPAFDLSTPGIWELSFDVGVTDFGSTAASAMGSDDEVQLLASTDGGATWTTIYTWNATTNPPSNTGDNYIVDLSVYSGDTQFAFWGSEGTVDDAEDFDFFVDNFEIRMVSSCLITELTTGAQTACDPSTVTYTQDVVVTFTDPPATGMLDVNGELFAIGTSPQTVTLTGLAADGAAVDVAAFFDANPACRLDSVALFTAAPDCTPPPANDLCGAAEMLTVQLDSCSTYSLGGNAGATDSGEGTPTCGSYSGGDLWFEVTIPATGSIIFDVGVVDYTSLAGALYSGACGALTEIGCTEFATGWPFALSGLTPGAHFLRVWDYGNNEVGDFELCAYDFSCTPATGSINADCLTDTSFQVIFDLTALGSSASYTLQDNQGTAPLTGITAVGMYPYGVYPNGTVVDFDLITDDLNCDLVASVTEDCTPPPANDLCGAAELLTVQVDSCSTYSLGTNVGATDSAEGTPSCGSYAGGDLWFEVTIPATGSIIFDVGTVDYTSLAGALYSGACGTLTEIGCTEFATGWPFALSGLTPGAHFLRVWDYGNDQVGDFELCAYDFSCTLPTGTITADCLTDTSFQVIFDLTALGSSATYTLQDNQGTAPLTGLAAVGMYNYGTYANGTIVDFDLLSVDNSTCDAVVTGISTDCTPPATDNCGAYTSSPGALIDDLNDPMDTITVAGTGPMVLSDINVIIAIDHTFLGDLDITLTSPSGTVVNVMFDQCLGNDNINAEFDDEAANPIVCGTPTIGTFTTPSGNLADFYGETFDGDWILSVVDDAGGDDGVLLQWCLVPTLVTPTACAITELTAGAQRACSPATNTYTQDIVITYTDQPATGLIDINGQTFPIGTSPQTVTLTGLTADGLDVDVSAFFTADALCNLDSLALFTAAMDCTPPPANDDCAGAISLTQEDALACGTPVPGNLDAATDSGIAGCLGTANDDVWYSFQALSTDPTIELVDAFDGVVELFEGPCTALVSIGCADLGIDPTINATGLTIGNTYFVRVYAWSSTTPATTDFTICVYGAVCTAPVASVATNCLDDNNFELILDITVLGSSTTYTLQDNQGTTPLTGITAVGMYNFGTYPNGTVVDLDLLSVDDPNCDAFATGLTTDCSPICGTSQADSGGAAGVYGDNELITWTLCPDNPGDVITVTFTSFEVEGRAIGTCWDALFIYDGDALTDPLIGPVAGHCWESATDGTEIPGGALNTPITSTHPSGCLTFEFESDGSGTFDGWVYDITCAPPVAAGVALDVKFILEGPFDQATGLMKDDLRAMGLLPLMEPYTALAAFTHSGPGGGETVASTVFDVTGPDAIIDWAFVELRDATTNTMVMGTRAALLQADGSLVDIDGVSPVLFAGIPDGDYFVTVRHRNHVAIMSDVAVTLGSVVNPTLDFTPGGAFGTNPQKLVGTTYVLYESDLDANGAVDAADRSAAWNSRNLTGYLQDDSNLNGVCDAAERAQAWNNRNVTTKVP